MKIKIIIITIAITLLLQGLIHAQSPDSSYSVKLAKRTGLVQVKTMGGSWVPVYMGTTLTQGDIIRTGKDATAILEITSNNETADIEISENTTLKLSEIISDMESDSEINTLDLEVGKILVNSKKLQSDKSKFRVKTPTSIIGVKGTSLSVSVKKSDTTN